MADSLGISRQLKNNSISLSPNNPWLFGCIEWYKTQNDVVNFQQLYEYVCNQWLLADLRDIQEACLPTVNNENICITLTGQYSVQVNWIRDVGQSSYSQLKKLQLSNEAESNETLTEEKPEKWEPRPTRMYMMEITDGITTLLAMEYSRINKLEEPFFPGTKILISGPLECRRGVLLLQENNVTILGGEVFSLLIPNSTENIIAKSLNIEELSGHQPIENSNNHRNVSLTMPVYRDTTPISHANNNNEDFANSTEEQMDFLASDEDEALLLQIHTEALQSDDDKNKFQNENKNSNVANALSNPRLSYEPNDHNFKTPERNYSGEHQTLQTNANQDIMQPESQVNRSTSIRNNSDESMTFKNLTTLPRQKLPLMLQSSGSGLQSEGTTLTSEQFNDEEDDIFASLEEEPQYPFCKQVEGVVQSLKSRLKIRDSEWTLTAMISDGNSSFDVGFSSEVLEEIIGFSAVEVEAKREEMASNPAIKEKFNPILKNGLHRLKTLKCIMTIEFTSPSETPRVVAVDL